MPTLDYPVRIESLAADERPKYWFEYTVSGRGVFPYDMLRFDQCWPASTGDAASIDPWPNHRTVKLCSNREPRIGRWESFGWKVT